MAPSENELLMYVGTYTRRQGSPNQSEGIYVFRYDPATGACTQVSTAAAVNPSFLAIDPSGHYLYSVSELSGKTEGEPGGAINAYRLDRKTGELTYINQSSTGGDGPCHLVVDATGRHVLASNYAGGSICVLPIQDGGSVGEAVSVIQHEGSSVNPQRQNEPHPHSINVSPSNRYAYVPDLGTDKVMIYEFDSSTGQLKASHDQPWARTKSGAGPRHLAFHPSQKFLYVIDELDSTVTAFNWDSQRGTLKEIHTVPTLPSDFKGRSHCADIHVHPNGKFVYGSNRGHDSIVVYSIEERTGQLTTVEHVSTQGEIPRNFAIDPAGRHLLAANQNTNDIFVYEIDSRTGKLKPIGDRIEVPSPVCIKFLRV